MWRILTKALICGSLTSFSNIHASAQYSIDWFKISDGSSTSTGAMYSVSGTIGQHEAGGPMNGASYSLTGGFWSIFAVVATESTNPTPSLAITLSNAVLISWPYPSTRFVLEQTSDLVGGNWSNVTNAPVQIGQEWQVIINPVPGNSFYRLRSQ